MITQLEFYDKDIIKNTLGVLTVKPDKVIYVYDNELTDMNRFLSLEKCFKKHMADIEVDKVPINITAMEEMYRSICDIVDDSMANGNRCIIDLTGGSELMIVSAYRAGIEKGAELIYTDIIKEQILDLKTNKYIGQTAILTLDDFINARGAELIGTSHDEPEPHEFQRVLDMCRYLFTHLNQWKSTCAYFQVAMAASSPSELDLRTKAEIRQKGGKKVSPDKNMLYEFQRQGFIKDLYISDKYIVLSATSKKCKSYLISFGVWLEMFVYIHAIQTKAFGGVQLGTMIDWDAYNGITVAGNEIDVMLQDGSIPVFISCKLRAADTAALNELVIAKKRVGGWFSKSILVSFGDDKITKSGTYKRAKELGIEILDRTDILSDNFGERLVKSIRDHDLVSLKWKKI